MTAKVVTAVAWDFSIAERMLGKIGAQLLRVPLFTEEDVIKNAGDAEGVIAGVIEPFTPKVLRAMTKCKIISRVGIGVDNIDMEEATRLGISVAIVVDAQSQEVSDYAVAFILAFNRKLFPITQVVRAGAWRPGSKDLMRVRADMFRLNKQTLGLVGVGRIGSLVARKAKALGLRVLVHDPYVSAEVVQKLGAEGVDFDRLLQESDYISLHAPLTPETKNLLGLKEFKKMKRTAYLINAARGGLIDEQALYQAITEGLIAGAGLDVTEPEPPPPDHPLLKLDKVFVTGHSAYFSDSCLLEAQQTCTEAVVMALQGLWPSNLANPQVQKQANRRIA